MTAQPPTRSVRHPIFARVYALLSRGMEEHGTAEHRRRLLAGLRGRVIEVGAGNGLNFRHYPQAVAEVVAVEPEPYLRALAVEVVPGVVELEVAVPRLRPARW